MPTIVGHALVGISIMNVARPWLPEPWRRVSLLWPAILAIAPDADVLAFRFGIPYGDHFGHRGFSHSLVGAALLGTLGVARLAFHWRDDPAVTKGGGVAAMLLLLSAIAASHPLLDMLTDGGLGCALLAPFSWERMFFPTTPIPVSPIGLGPGLLDVLWWELKVFLPVFVASLAFAHAFKKAPAGSDH